MDSGARWQGRGRGQCLPGFRPGPLSHLHTTQFLTPLPPLLSLRLCTGCDVAVQM